MDLLGVSLFKNPGELCHLLSEEVQGPVAYLEVVVDEGAERGIVNELGGSDFYSPTILFR